MYDKYFEKFMPSADMRNYIKDILEEVENLPAIIRFSMCPVTEKIAAYKALSEEAEANSDMRLKNLADEYCRYYEKALEITSSKNGIWLLYYNKYDEEISDMVGSVDGIYDSYDKAVDEFISWLDEDEQKLKWYNIVYYEKNADGKFEKICCFDFIRDQLTYVDLQNEDEFEEVCSSNRELSLPVPFKAGDILKINGYPYVPDKYVLMITRRDNIDCCCIQDLYRDADGNLGFGALKHGMIGHRDSFSIHPPLMSAHVVAPETEGVEDIFKKLHYFIDGDIMMGERVLETLFKNTPGHCFEDLEECINKIITGELEMEQLKPDIEEWLREVE